MASGEWGYACCHSTTHASYCSGRAGIEATEASSAQNLLAAAAAAAARPTQLSNEAHKDDEESQKRKTEDETTSKKRKYNNDFTSDAHEVTDEQMGKYLYFTVPAEG